MSDFKTMSGDERKALIDKISACLMENDLGDVTISTATENVGILMAGQFEKSTTLKVEKNLKADQSAKGKTITDALKAIVGDTKSVSIKIQALLGAGDYYQTISDIEKMGAEGTTSLEHKEGEVWMIDFWATWCPPC
jgi:hypothetical protein